jgi:hypothetical protein
MILFFADVRVKENRKSLLCKKSGGDAEICESSVTTTMLSPSDGREPFDDFE